MRYALIIAGGSGTRLWPMSTRNCPKQLIPFIEGKSLLQLAMERLSGLIPDDRICVCAGSTMRSAVLENLPQLSEHRFIAEPVARDTLNAVTLGTSILGRDDPDAVVAVFTADHIIEPVADFQRIVERGYKLAEQSTQILVTFGITPTDPATGYGYLQLGDPVSDYAYLVDRFREKPSAKTANEYFRAGSSRYLWNSGMFVWRAATLMNCVARYAPANYQAISKVVAEWDGPGQNQILERLYPTLDKISVDYAVMEPASEDPNIQVVAVPMPLRWLDVGSWPSFAQTHDRDEEGNVACDVQSVMLETSNTLVVSDDPEHLVATIGCDDLIIVHTGRATLVCKANRAEQIKQLHEQLVERFGSSYQ